MSNRIRIVIRRFAHTVQWTLNLRRVTRTLTFDERCLTRKTRCDRIDDKMRVSLSHASLHVV